MAWLLRITASLLLLVASSLVTALPARADTPEPAHLDGAVTAFDVSVTSEGLPTLEVNADDRAHLPEDVVLDVDAGSAQAGHQLGWSTLRLPEGGQAALELSITGPGQVLAEDVADDGSRAVLLDSTDEADDTLVLPAAAYGWPLWTFSEPGQYEIEATPRVEATDGTAVSGETSRYLIEVAAPDDSGQTDPGGTDPGEQTPTDPPPSDQAPPSDTPPAEDPAPAEDEPVRTAAEDDEACEVPGLPANAVRASEGHFDYGVQVKNGAMTSLVKDDRPSPAVWRAPGKMLFELGTAAKTDVPDNPTFSFLGKPGEKIWTIGQTQETNVPWLGWNTQHESAIENIPGSTTWKLDDVEGPGELFVYQTGSFGNLIQMLGTPDSWPKSVAIPHNTHAHGNWSFTEPGIYKIATTHTARLTSGQTVSSSGTLTFRVGPCAKEAPDDTASDGGKNTADDTDDTAPAPKSDPAPRETPSPGSTPAPSSNPLRDCVPASGDSGKSNSANDDAGDTTPDTGDAVRQTSVSDGHFDFGSNIVNSALVARVKDDRTQPPKWVAPESLRFVLGSASRKEVPSGSAYSFLGKPGDPIWLIPQTQVSGVPWLGWNTQHDTVRSQVNGSVKYTLDGVDGPGDLAVYLTDSFGGVGEKVFGNVGGFPTSFTVPLNVHAHGNWAFTKAGTYKVTMTQTAKLKSGKSVSDTSTLTFVVGGRSASGGRSLGLTLPLSGQVRWAPLTPVSAAGDEDCVLPSTGADDTLTLLLPLGLTLVASGAALLVVRRRAARV